MTTRAWSTASSSRAGTPRPRDGKKKRSPRQRRNERINAPDERAIDSRLDELHSRVFFYIFLKRKPFKRLRKSTARGTNERGRG